MKQRSRWRPFAVFVAASGSRWILATYFPSELPPIAEQSLHSLAIGSIAGLAAIKHLRQIKHWPAIYLYGVLLTSGISIVLSLAHSTVQSNSGLVLLTFVPAAMVFLRMQQAEGFSSNESLRGLLLPALAASGGALLLVPVGIPQSIAGKLWLLLLAACCLLVAWAALRLHGLLQNVGVFISVALIYLASGAATGIAAVVKTVPPLTVQGSAREVLFCALIDGPLALLLVWLLREMPPLRFAARFLLVPLVSIIEGMAIVRDGLTATTLAGMVLIVVGAANLLRSSAAEPAST